MIGTIIDMSSRMYSNLPDYMTMLQEYSLFLMTMTSYRDLCRALGNKIVEMNRPKAAEVSAAIRDIIDIRWMPSIYGVSAAQHIRYETAEDAANHVSIPKHSFSIQYFCKNYFILEVPAISHNAARECGRGKRTARTRLLVRLDHGSDQGQVRDLISQKRKPKKLTLRRVKIEHDGIIEYQWKAEVETVLNFKYLGVPQVLVGIDMDISEDVMTALAPGALQQAAQEIAKTVRSKVYRLISTGVLRANRNGKPLTSSQFKIKAFTNINQQEI